MVRRRRHDVFGRECGLIRFVRAFQFGQGEPWNHDSSWRQPTHMLHPWPCLHARARNLEPEREPHGLGLRRRHCFTAAWWAAIATCACGRPQSWVSRLRKATCDVHMGSARRRAFRVSDRLCLRCGRWRAGSVSRARGGCGMAHATATCDGAGCDLRRNRSNHFSFYGAKSWALGRGWAPRPAPGPGPGAWARWPLRAGPLGRRETGESGDAACSMAPYGPDATRPRHSRSR